jgi:hypothetical protein
VLKIKIFEGHTWPTTGTPELNRQKLALPIVVVVVVVATFADDFGKSSRQ